MARQLITPLSTPAGRHSAKVYRDLTINGFRGVFYVDGVKAQGADADNDTEAEALEEAAHSLKVADEIHAGLLARAATASAQS